MKKYKNYDDVPWLRKSNINTFLILVSVAASFLQKFASGLGFVLVITLASLLVIPCIVLVTGDIYYNKKDKKDDEGHLKRWGTANKVLALIILVWQFWVFVLSPWS